MAAPLDCIAERHPSSTGVRAIPHRGGGDANRARSARACDGPLGALRRAPARRRCVRGRAHTHIALPGSRQPRSVVRPARSRVTARRHARPGKCALRALFAPRGGGAVGCGNRGCPPQILRASAPDSADADAAIEVRGRTHARSGVDRARAQTRIAARVFRRSMRLPRWLAWARWAAGRPMPPRCGGPGVPLLSARGV